MLQINTSKYNHSNYSKLVTNSYKIQGLKTMEDVRTDNLLGYKLRELVEGIYQPQCMYNSLPFIVQKDGEYQIRWFYYDLKRYDDKCYLRVRRIITLDSTGRCAITLNPLVTVEWDLKVATVDYPELDWYDEFIKYFKNAEYQKILELLVEYESDAAIMLYDRLSHQYL